MYDAVDGGTVAVENSSDRGGTPVGEEEFDDSDVPVTQSLESRIEAILSQSADCAVPFLSPRSTSPVPPSMQPPLPVDEGFPGPPLPCPPDAALFPDDPHPPLPLTEFWPMSSADGSGLLMYRDVPENMRTFNELAAVNGHGGPGEEDDRMSMSSLSSGEEKLEVNVPASAGLLGSQWPSSSSSAPVVNSAYLVEKLNQLNELKSMLEPTPDSLETVLDQVITDLRRVMCRDVRKKMIELTGFKSFEKWCDDKFQYHKVC